MRLVWLSLLFLFFAISSADDLEKYRPLREQCSRTPSNSECLQLKSKFLQLITKCQKINTRQQVIICQEVKAKLCAVFPSTCAQPTTTTRKRTKPKATPTTTQTITTTRKRTKPKSKVTPTTLITTTTTTEKLTTSETMTNEEFVKVPVNPDELRTRGEYCIRHGKEKKCQQLLNNLKITYSSCNKKKFEITPTKSEQIDCHSFQTHLCKAFPKFPPCLKKSPSP